MLSEPDTQTTCTKIIEIVKEAAADTIGYAKVTGLKGGFNSEIEALSLKQKKLRPEIRRLRLENVTRRLDDQAREAEQLRDGAQMFQPVRLMKRKKTAAKPVVEDKDGRTVGNSIDAAAAVVKHSCSQFNSETSKPVEAFVGDPRPLENPITQEELQQSIGRLSNDRACAPDAGPAEFKFGSETLTSALASRLKYTSH